MIPTGTVRGSINRPPGITPVRGAIHRALIDRALFAGTRLKYALFDRTLLLRVLLLLVNLKQQ